jgi:disulfide bond formation protein DsbB
MVFSDSVALLVMSNMPTVKQLSNVALNRWYWLVFIAGGIFLIATALYFQFVHDELPCTLCIHVRLWVTLFIIVSFIGLMSRSRKVINILAQLSIVLTAGVLIERSWQLIGTERGFLPGTCSFDLGLPAWFAIEEWLPWLFRVETTCGKTPVIIFGVTMAESLMVLSILLIIISLCVLLASLITAVRRDL